jgi:hypothetical protein
VKLEIAKRQNERARIVQPYLLQPNVFFAAVYAHRNDVASTEPILLHGSDMTAARHARERRRIAEHGAARRQQQHYTELHKYDAH